MQLQEASLWLGFCLVLGCAFDSIRWLLSSSAVAVCRAWVRSVIGVPFDLSLVDLAVFGFFTGLGTTFGTELAKFLIARIRERVNHVP